MGLLLCPLSWEREGEPEAAEQEEQPRWGLAAPLPPRAAWRTSQPQVRMAPGSSLQGLAFLC